LAVRGEIKMEQRQIIAIVVIIVIVAAGVGLWLFLPAPYGAVVTGQLVTPGAPAGTPENRIITVGIINDMTEIQGEGAWRGAYLACDEINTAGGVTIGSDTYYFGIVAEDTGEAGASPVAATATAAATKLVTDDGAQFAIGGFRTEMVLAYQDIFMDEEMLFFGSGASTDVFCQNVLDDYDKYKYFFRTMPINSTSLAISLLSEIAYLDAYMTTVTGLNISKVAIIREGLDWTEGMSAFLNGYLPLYGFEIVKEVAYPIDAEAADFTTYWQQIDAAGAQITIPIISAQGGILMTSQYAQVQPDCLIAGIDVMAQLDTYWTQTNGACEYEIVLQSTLRTNKTTKTIPFWDSFLSHYGNEPLYTAIGSYDAMYCLKLGIEEAQSLDSNAIIPFLEAHYVTDPIEGAGGNIAFTPSHDLFLGYSGDTIYSATLFTQWQEGGTKVAISSGGALYPDWVVTGQTLLPDWWDY
jgi:branched-chain amino acid transport system substrate-binding protein